jgi:alcohol dehydrogenase
MKMQFGFNLPTRIECGAGMIKSVGELVRKIQVVSRVFLVTDSGIIKTGLSNLVIDLLKTEGFECQVFDQVQPNPKDYDCEAGAREARSFGADLIVAVGGGSVLDSAKAIALLQTHDGKLREYEGKGKVKHPLMPILAIPTTAGTGSEVTRSAVITDTERKFKMTVKDLLLAPRLALVDPETTYTLPASLTASTGMDALVHAIEAYTCREANPIADALALAAIEKIYPSLKVAVRDGDNRQARNDLMIGSLMAGIAFSHADVAAVHCMAEAIGGLYDTPHGVANSIFLPIVTAFNSEADLQKHARIAQACGLPVSHLSPQQASALLVEKLAELAQEIGIPLFKSIPGVNPVDFERLAAASAINGSTPSNCRQVSESDYLELFRAAYKA